MKFLRNLLAVLAGLFIFSGLVVLVFIGIIAASSMEKKVTVSDNTILHIIVSGDIAEREVEDPFSELSLPGMGPLEMGLKEVKQAIRNAASDEKVKGIYLEPRIFSAGFASLEEIRQELLDFRETDKFIIAYSEFYSEQGYYLASVADEIYLTPDYGFLEFNGLNIELVFIKKMLDKIGVEPQIFRVGDFKSAVEPFIRTDMSEENEEQITSFVNSIYDHLLGQIASSRGLNYETIKNISDSMLVREPEDALALGLITGISYEDEVQNKLREKLSLEEGEKVETLKYRKYNKSTKDSQYAKDRIAVIYSTGAIVMGKGDDRSIGVEKYVDLIRDAGENDRVKAIVLRINSGGGSALASDVMWNEIRNAAHDKPVIASLSDVAASGGYYMAMGCDTIMASRTTITGSIGIFSMLFNAQELMEDKLGITFDNVNTGHFSDIYTLTRPLTTFEKQILQDNVEEGYRIFTTKAAESRDMPVEKLLNVASGRVWSGSQAAEIGLVDAFGTLEDAIELAGDMAGLDTFRVVEYPVQKTFLEQIMSDLGEEVETMVIKGRLGDLFPVFEQVKSLEEYMGPQARMPYAIELR